MYLLQVPLLVMETPVVLLFWQCRLLVRAPVIQTQVPVFAPMHLLLVLASVSQTAALRHSLFRTRQALVAQIVTPVQQLTVTYLSISQRQAPR